MYQPATSLFDRRSTKQPPESPSRAYRHISVSIRQESELLFESPSYATTARRPTMCGFLPLPPISASPICTPTTSTSSRIVFGGESSSSGTDSFITAPPTPSDSGSLKAHAPPTWISIPPTPPPKLCRRSVTCVAYSPAVSPSASFPAALSHPQRRASAPSLRRTRSSSEASVRRHKSRNISDVIASPLHTSPMFAISHQVSSDNEDSGEASGSLDGSSSDQNHDISLQDRTRKYYALMELLSTEVRYLMDLRVLVMIYLRQLPTITCRTPSGSAFGRTSSFTSASRSNSHTYLNASLNNSFTAIADMHGLQPMTTITPEKKEKGPPRYLFTNSEIEMLTRNAEDILQFHEHLVEELRTFMTPLGFPMDFEITSDPPSPSQPALFNLEIGLSFIATKFATEASRFNAYEPFCAGHPEALVIVRRIQHQYSTEWDAYEQRCSSLITELLGPESSPSLESADIPSPPPLLSSTTDCSSSSTPPVTTPREKKRRSSISSIDGAVRSLKPKSASGHSRDSDTSSRHKRRLVFVDYLITPVQRICRYPMLLDQFKSKKNLKPFLVPVPLGRSDVNVVVQSAAQAMRHVASRVDEARHRHDVALQSSLIATRISRTMPTLPTVQANSARVTLQFLTPSFLSSLGVCLLAGSLDVIHHHSPRPNAAIANVNAKYLGAFLYLGGYLILVKVSKGKTYEPRHWFRLSDFELYESDEDALLPCSFRLRSKGYQFELAAACQREKEAWLTSIRESLSHTTTDWINEPTSSIQADRKPDHIEATVEGASDCNGLSVPVQSIPDIDKNIEYPEFTASLLAAISTDPHPSQEANPKRRHEGTRDLPSRRSSSASMKAIFTPMAQPSDTVVIRRSSPSARMAVDQGLRDVISEPCVTARSHASSHEEELFQAPSITRSGPPIRTQSTLSMARLKKHESVRVPRRKSIMDPYDPLPKKSGFRAKSLMVKSRPQPLSIASIYDGEGALFLSSQPSSSLSQSPATTLFPISSTVSSPTRDNTFPSKRSRHSTAGAGERSQSFPRPNSLVNTVGGFFRSRPPSPVRSTTLASPTRKTTHEMLIQQSTSTFKRWIKGPFHRRTHSAPEDPKTNESPSLPDFSFGNGLGLTSSLTLMPEPELLP